MVREAYTWEIDEFPGSFITKIKLSIAYSFLCWAMFTF